MTVSETCRSIAYASRDVYADATQLITSQAGSTLGAPYSLMGEIRVSIIRAAIINTRQATAQISVYITATWVYQITHAVQQHLIRLIAGKTNQQAAALLLQIPGVAGVQISVKGGNRTLPDDPKNIHIIVVYRSA